ncbi:HDOD domain-containing protein [bacterium]|nr:HDOD domain-containing protein [bacterium]
MSDTLSFIDEIEQAIESGKAALPVFDPTAQRVQQELVKSDPDLDVVEKLIIRDQALASEVLRLANSPCFRGLAEIQTIKTAMVRLGMQEVCRIALLAASKRQFNSSDRDVRQMLKSLWQHSAGCALAANWLTRRCKYEELAGQAFFAGLLHDIGKLAILMVIEQIKLQRTKQMTDSLLKEVIQTLHAQQGYILMTGWHMPEQYCTIVRDHHLIDVDAKNTLLIIVRLANMTCHKLGIGISSIDHLDVVATPEAHLMNLTELDFAELEIMLEDTRALWQ